jgi:PAS domain S-box-containing protein
MNKNVLQSEYARYKFVIENIKDVIWEADANAEFTFISPAIQEMAGYDASQMLGRCI